jgi:hypothetical protein
VQELKHISLATTVGSRSTSRKSTKRNHFASSETKRVTFQRCVLYSPSKMNWAGFGGEGRGFFCCKAQSEKLLHPVSNASLVFIE